MNNKHLIFRLVVIALLAALAAMSLASFMDNFGNGFFKDWFYNNFISREKLADGSVVRVFYNWSMFKDYIIAFMVTVLVIVSVIIVLVMYYMSNRRAREMRNTIESMRLDAERHEQLLQMETQRKSDLITYLAHDMRTPLASIIGYLSLLDEVPEMPAEQRARYVGITLDKAYRLEQLIEEFFDVSRFNLQTIVLNRQKLDLALLQQQMADEFYPLLEPSGKAIDVQTPAALIYKGDGDKLARVFNNIIKNAVSYSYEGTTIVVRARKDEDRPEKEGQNGRIRVEIESRGATIPPHQQEQIFEKFFRLDSSRSSQTGGAGLGLAIAREIVDAHGGSIAVESENERTVFTVQLPLTD